MTELRSTARLGEGGGGKGEGKRREGRVCAGDALTFRDCRNVAVRALHAMFSREAVLVSSSLGDTLIYHRGF